MDNTFRKELRSLIMNHYAGTPQDEVKQVLDDIGDVIDEHGLVPSNQEVDDWDEESDED